MSSVAAPQLPPPTRSRQLSIFPNQEFTMEDLENLFGTNKESMANLFGWSQNDPKFSISGAGGGNGSKAKSKGGSLDFSAWLDNSNNNNGTNSGNNNNTNNNNPLGSMSLGGKNGNSITELIQNMISSGSIDFTNMNNQERRNSILKIINDQSSLKNPRNARTSDSSIGSSIGTTLRQDIFDKDKSKKSPLDSIENQQGNTNKFGKSDNLAPGQTLRGNTGKGSTVPGGKDQLSPTSSISSKASRRNEEGQSPKTSPTFSESRVNDPYASNPYNQRPPLAQAPQQRQYKTNANSVSPLNLFQFSGFPSFSNASNGQVNFATGFTPTGNRQNSFLGGNYSFPSAPASQPLQFYNQQMPMQIPFQGRAALPQNLQPQQLQQSQQSVQQPIYQPVYYQQGVPGHTQHQLQQPQQHQQFYQPYPPQQQLVPQYSPSQQAPSLPQENSNSTNSHSKTNKKKTTKRPPRKNKEPSVEDIYGTTNNPNLMPAQQFAKSEDGRPLLGATKIDQLMLVIQARDKGVTKSIEQGPDGSILASPGNYIDGSAANPEGNVLPRPVSLVGGVEKPHRPKSEVKGNGEIDEYGQRQQGQQQAHLQGFRSAPGPGPGPGLEQIQYSQHRVKDSEGSPKRKKTKTQQCPYCLKYFTQSTHLEVHIRSHIGYKPYECSYCHKKFTQGGNLRTHLRLHTGEKPFTCDICSRSFNRKGNLEAHKLTHEHVKPYECRLDNCDKSFTQLGNLKSHQNRFHLETLNALTHKLAELSGPAIDSLPADEKDLLLYFKDLYRNSNKGIRGRGKHQRGASNADGTSGVVVAQSSPTQ